MAFGQATPDIQPVENEKVQGQAPMPSPASRKLAFQPKKKKMAPPVPPKFGKFGK